MAIRHAAAYAAFKNEDDIVHAARTAMFTHCEATAQTGGEFFARVTYRIIHKGQTAEEAIHEPSSGWSSRFTLVKGGPTTLPGNAESRLAERMAELCDFVKFILSRPLLHTDLNS